MGGRSKGMRKEGGKITIEGNGSVCEEGSERVGYILWLIVKRRVQ